MPKQEQYYKVYQAWGDMKYKCNNPKCKTYKRFGGAGIGYAPEWEDYNTFRADMLPGYLELFEKGIPSKKITLGRIDTSKDFSAENCRWISPFEQTISLNAQQLNFVVAQGPSGVKRIFPSLKDMSDYYGVSRTAASNALHRGTNFVKNIVFTVIDKADYDRALVDQDFLESLKVSYNKEAFDKNIIRSQKILKNKMKTDV